MTDIYSAIKADHDRHRALLKKIAETSGDSTERKEAWNEFYHDVKGHAAAEEETFYSKLISKTWGQDAARHSVHEHQQLDDLMEELNETDMSSGGWLQKFKTLRATTTNITLTKKKKKSLPVPARSSPSPRSRAMASGSRSASRKSLA